MKTSPYEFPGIFKSALIMLADQGKPTAITSLVVPDVPHAREIDTYLQSLSETDLIALSVGDPDDMNRVLAAIEDDEFVMDVHTFLGNMFMLIGD